MDIHLTEHTPRTPSRVAKQLIGKMHGGSAFNVLDLPSTWSGSLRDILRAQPSVHTFQLLPHTHTTRPRLYRVISSRRLRMIRLLTHSLKLTHRSTCLYLPRRSHVCYYSTNHSRSQNH